MLSRIPNMSPSERKLQLMEIQLKAFLLLPEVPDFMKFSSCSQVNHFSVSPFLTNGVFLIARLESCRFVNTVCVTTTCAVLEV